MKNAARLIYTLTAMSTEEAERFNVERGERRRLVRVDSGKVNLCPGVAAQWFKMVGVELDNATDDYPNGDNVHTVEPWTPPDIWGGVDVAMQNRILDDIEAGMDFGVRYSDHNSAKEKAAWRVIQKHVPDKSEAAAKDIVREWVKSELLVRNEYDDPVERKPRKGLYVDDAKRPK